MLERILEPEVMDTHEEAMDYDAMDHGQVNRIFVDDLCAAVSFDLLEAETEEEETFDILDLGTGTALIPILLCQQVPHARIMAADASIAMLELARLHLELESLTERVQLCQADAKNLEFASEMFDLVMSNSIIHHIPEPQIVLEQALRVTKPNGYFFFRDLMRPTTKAELDDLVQTYAGEENENQQRMFAESLHAALSLSEIQTMVKNLGFEPETVQATSDRHWTWIAQKEA